MTAAADLVLRGGEIRAGDETWEAVAVRDGRVVRRSVDYEAEFLTGVETTVVELDGRVAVPGFVDARAAIDGGLDPFAERAFESGVTSVHVAAPPERAAACRDAAVSGGLDLRVRLQYPESLRGALRDVGLRTNHGGRVRVGALVLDATAPDCEDRALRAAESGFQVAIEADTRAAADAAVAALADCRPNRHRVEGAVPRPDALARFEGVVVADGAADGLSAVVESNATLALGGAEPLDSVAAAVDAGLSAETAVRAHTHGGRVAGFEVAPDRAEFVVFDGDPFADPAGTNVALTVAGGRVVYDTR